METATFAGGCFWCLEAVFEQLEGVERVVSGYSGGDVANPRYDAVCAGRTGHAEVVRVEFRPEVISYNQLLEVFFAIHDPTMLNRQGADIGTQYRSAIFVHSATQRAMAQALMEKLTADRVFPSPIVTVIEDVTDFYPAEDYHQGYFRENPAQGYCVAVVSPKLAKARKRFLELIKPALR